MDMPPLTLAIRINGQTIITRTTTLIWGRAGLGRGTTKASLNKIIEISVIRAREILTAKITNTRASQSRICRGILLRYCFKFTSKK